MSKIKYLPANSYKEMPWKNGAGKTREIAVEINIHNESESPFLWRLSIAGVEEDGPFSNFPHVDRHLMMIEGNGISLDGGDNGVGFLYETLQHYQFPGDIEIEGRLSDGPIRNLNLMTDRRYAQGDMAGFYVDDPQQVMLKSDVHFIHLLEGSAPVTIDLDGELRVLQAGASYRFNDMSGSLTIMPMGEGSLRSAVAFISIDNI